VSDTVGRSGIVGPSIGWGTLFGAAVAFATLFCLVLATGAGMRNGDFGLLMGLAEIPAVIVGGIAGAVLFGVVGLIVRFSPVRPAALPLSYAILGSLLWGAGWWLLSVNVAQGRAQTVCGLMLNGLLPVAIAGLLTGSMVRRGRHQAYRTSHPGANR
jgi:hypothetical protein